LLGREAEYRPNSKDSLEFLRIVTLSLLQVQYYISILEYLPYNKYFNMPDLFKQIIQRKKESVAFPIREYWLDVGRPDDLAKGGAEYLVNI
jgi:NDP-sugar pyrophosphorylase family protein